MPIDPPQSIDAPKRAWWMRPSLRRDDLGGHLTFGPIQVNWGYTPGVRIYLTWPGDTRCLELRGRRSVLWGGRAGIDRQALVRGPQIRVDVRDLRRGIRTEADFARAMFVLGQAVASCLGPLSAPEQRLPRRPERSPLQRAFKGIA